MLGSARQAVARVSPGHTVLPTARPDPCDNCATEYGMERSSRFSAGTMLFSGRKIWRLAAAVALNE
jgi:hypothetical protein